MRLDGSVESMLDSPCIGVCTTRQFGDLMCKGCGRSETEIAEWARLPAIYKKLRVIDLSEQGYAVRHMRPVGWRPNPKPITEV
jgi:predicted Fe-S protein YdhL (DUF1289 family)